jgi:hypothetical protein
LEDTITTTYCLCEEFLKAIGHHDDPQTLLATAEVMTVALTEPAPSSAPTSSEAASFSTSRATCPR